MTMTMTMTMTLTLTKNKTVHLTPLFCRNHTNTLTHTHTHTHTLALACFLITSFRPGLSPTTLTAWLQSPSPSPSPSLCVPTLARSAVALDKWLVTRSAHAAASTRALLLHQLLLSQQQQDPALIDTRTILHTLNLLHKHSLALSLSSSSTQPPSPADYLHTHVLPHLTHLAASHAPLSPSCHQPLRRLLAHPLVISSPSPDLLLARLRLLLIHLHADPSPALLAAFPHDAWHLFTAHHINALWTLVTPNVSLQAPARSAPDKPAPAPSPALLSQLVSRVPLAQWNTTTWILAAHCPYLNPADVARVYLGQPYVPRMARATATYVDWRNARDQTSPTRTLVRAVNPLVRRRSLLVLTVLLERLLPNPAHYALADALLDAARGLDWNTRFLNAVLEGYARAGQWDKARHVFEDLMDAPDVYTLRVMLTYYAHTPEDVGRVVAQVRARARNGHLEMGNWGAYWLVRAALMGGGGGGAGGHDVQDAARDWKWTAPPTPVDNAAAAAADGADAAELPRGNWAYAHAILAHLLTHTPDAVLPVTCHLVLRAYAQRGQITKIDRLARTMRAHGKWHRESAGLVMMGYVKHMQGWLRPRYSSAWQRDTVRERGFEDVWRVFAQHVAELAPGERPAGSAVYWLLAAHPPAPAPARRTLRAVQGVPLDVAQVKHLWRLAYRLTTRGHVRASVHEVLAQFVSQVRVQFAADPERVDEWEEWVAGYLETRGVRVVPAAVVRPGDGDRVAVDVVRWLDERLLVERR